MAARYYAYVDGTELEVVIHQDGRVEVDGEEVVVDMQHVTNSVIYSMLVDGHSYEIFANLDEDHWRIFLGGHRYTVTVEDERSKRLKEFTQSETKPQGDVAVRAPMPGLVIKVLVGVGQTVEANEPLLLLEAMKMENEMRAPVAGVVKEVRVNTQQAVELQQTLIVLGEPTG